LLKTGNSVEKYRDRIKDLFKGENAQALLSEFQQIANQGNVDSQLLLGYLLGEKVYFIVADDALAANWLNVAALSGHSGAQLELGKMYENGTGVKKDLEKSVELYRKAGTPEAWEAYSRLPR
jgi:TPR repeat protein